MNGVVLDTEREENAGNDDRRSAVDVAGEARGEREGGRNIDNRWLQPTGDSRLPLASGARSSLLRAHAAKSAESAHTSPKTRRTPRESRRVSLAQAPGYVQLNQYRLLEPIGQGSYGIVKLAYSEEDDTHFAMKILSKRKLMRRAGLFGKTPPRRPGPGPPPDPLQRIYREIAVLKKLDHPNVVKLVEVLDDPAEDQLYLVFQLLEGGPVVDVPTDNPLSEELARKYFRDAVLGVEYLHYQRIAHRDIKPANLLLGDGRVQLADLGASGELAGELRLAGAVGTPAFRAPEAAAAADTYLGEAADIWSLGVTLYAMVTGCVPWLGSSVVELQRRILSEPLAFPSRPPLSRPLKKLLFRMLDKDPATRATMKEIKEHEWVTADGKEPLPSEQENCRLVEVTDEDMARVVTSIPNLSTLILIKTMLKKHSFQNPFLRSREGSARRDSDAGDAGAGGAAASRAGGVAPPPRKPALARSGRSLSAPGNYMTEKQQSFDIALESVQESKEKDATANANDEENGESEAQNDKNKDQLPKANIKQCTNDSTTQKLKENSSQISKDSNCQNSKGGQNSKDSQKSIDSQNSKDSTTFARNSQISCSGNSKESSNCNRNSKEGVCKENKQAGKEKVADKVGSKGRREKTEDGKNVDSLR